MIKLFPLWFRVARFYVKARKINENKQLSNEQKYAQIIKLEKRYIGEKSEQVLQLAGENTKNAAVAIGFKDIAGIFIDIKHPTECLLYASAASQYLSQCISTDSHLLEALYFCDLYRGLAYLQDYDLKNACAMFDGMNGTINKAIERQPDNARLQQMQRYGYGEAYDGFVELYNSIQDKDMRDKLQVYVLDVLRGWLKQDPGNEKLFHLIEKWQA